jgi:hypothetical protein
MQAIEPSMLTNRVKSPRMYQFRQFNLQTVLLVTLIAVSSAAQEKPTAEVTGSYQFDHLTLSGSGASVSTNFPQGWDASVNLPILRWLGVVGDFGGIRKSESESFTGISASGTASVYTFGGGPQLTYRARGVQPFARFIFGDAHSVVSGSVQSIFGNFSSSASVDSFFIAPGGGADFRITHNVWLRGGADYFRTSKYGATVNGIRAFAGITFVFGGSEVPDPAGPQSRSASSQPKTAGVRIDALGVTVGLGRSGGAEITEVAAGGMAALTGLHSGDVINRVDERPIETPNELVTELSKRVAGDKLRLGYLIRGQWQSETIVTLGQSR